MDSAQGKQSNAIYIRVSCCSCEPKAWILVHMHVVVHPDAVVQLYLHRWLHKWLLTKESFTDPTHLTCLPFSLTFNILFDFVLPLVLLITVIIMMSIIITALISEVIEKNSFSKKQRKGEIR